MTALYFTSLEATPIEDICLCLNDSFADYEIPFSYTVGQLQTKIHVESIDLSKSVGAFKDNTLASFILHGCREAMLYNAGTGVIPSERGWGLTKRMYKHFLARHADSDAKAIRLEVLCGNAPAFKSYRSVGFEICRELVCYSGEPALGTSNSDFDVRLISWADYSNYSQDEAVIPSWQNDDRSLEGATETVFVGAYQKDIMYGIAALHPHKRRLHQLFVRPRYRRHGIATTLLSWITQHVSPIDNVSNVDSRAMGLTSFFDSIGMKRVYPQYEMELKLV